MGREAPADREREGEPARAWDVYGPSMRSSKGAFSTPNVTGLYNREERSRCLPPNPTHTRLAIISISIEYAPLSGICVIICREGVSAPL